MVGLGVRGWKTLERERAGLGQKENRAEAMVVNGAVLPAPCALIRERGDNQFALLEHEPDRAGRVLLLEPH